MLISENDLKWWPQTTSDRWSWWCLRLKWRFHLMLWRSVTLPTVGCADLVWCPGSPPVAACSSHFPPPSSGARVASAAPPVPAAARAPWLPGCGCRGPQAHSLPLHLCHLSRHFLHPSHLPLSGLEIPRAAASVTPPVKWQREVKPTELHGWRDSGLLIELGRCERGAATCEQVCSV